MDSRMQTNRRHPAGNGARNRRRRRRQRTQPAIWIIAAALVIILIYSIHMLSVLGVGTPTFYKGVYVWGVDLAGQTYEQGLNTMQTMLDDWRGRTFTFNYQEQSWTLKASDVGADLDLNSSLMQAWNIGHTGSIFARKNQIEALENTPMYLTAEPRYDEEALNAFVEKVRSSIDREPVDAEVVLTAEKPVLNTRSQMGYALDTEWLRNHIIELLKGGVNDEVISLQVETIRPAVDSSSASGGLELVVEWSTDTTTSSSRRLKNVELALSRFNGMAVYPDATMLISFNDVVGKRTVENGFNEAPEYNGTTVQNGIGGGVCQASSTLYGALLKAGFEVVQRNPHHMTVQYIKPSLDAAVNDYGSQDLVFRNNTDHVYYFYTEVNDKKATVRVYGNRPEYRIELESVIVEDKIKSEKIIYENDVKGELCWYTDEVKLYKEGKTGVRSQGYRVYYDWETGEEVKREQLSNDYYYPQADTYYVGVHNREE